MKCIALCSGKGGTGKSCVAAYTGAALAKAGHKTLLLELGGMHRCLDLILGVQEQTVFTSADLLAGTCSLEDATLPAEIQKDLFAVVGPATPAGPRELGALLRSLDGKYGFVLLDGAPLASLPADRLDMAVVVATPDSLCVRACAQTSRELHEAGVRAVRLIINNVPAQVGPILGAEDFDEIIDRIGAQLLGVIPTSPKLHYSANSARPLDPESLTVQIFDNIAGRLLGQRRPLLIR